MTDPIKVKVERKSLLTHGEYSERFFMEDDQKLEMLKRMGALFDKYSIERGDWASLAFALAFEHEPELKTVLDDGRKRRKTKETTWTFILHLYLWWDVTEYRLNTPRATIENACYKVSQKPEWAGYKVTREEFYRAKKSPFVEWSLNIQNRYGRDVLRDSMERFLLKREKIIRETTEVINAAR